MDDTDKIIAAIFAAALCSRSNANGPDNYLDQYETFLEKLNERNRPKPVHVEIAKFGE